MSSVVYWLHTKDHKNKISKGNLGRKMSEQNCDKMGGLSGMKSWHFDNCKFKENT